MRDIFPTWYQPPLNPPSVIELIVINWLAQEVPVPGELLAALLYIKGWRHREVYEFMKTWDWTETMYEGERICKHEYEYGFPPRFRKVKLAAPTD